MTNLLRVCYYLGLAQRRLYWKPSEMRRYQEKKLRSIVRYSYNFVPFYHYLLKKAGILPTDIKTLEDLSKLPLVRKEELRKEKLSDLLSTRETEKLKILRTSGSTGKPFFFYVNETENDWRKALYMRGNIACGQKPRDRWVVVTAPHHFYDITSLQRIIRVFSFECVNLFQPIAKQVNEVKKLNPDILDGYSGSLLLLARETEQQKIDSIRPRLIFGTADLIDPDSRKFVEQVFNAPFYDQFGCAEINRAAWQCPEKEGYHMDVDSVIVQFVDSNGEEVAVGEKGEVVYTSLFSKSQPFIRYAINDVGTALDDECSCGITLPMMKVVEGRKDSFIKLADGRVFSPMTFWTIMRYFKHADLIEQFRVIQNRLETIEVLVKKPRGIEVEEDFIRRKIVDHISKCIQTDETSLEIRIKFVEELEVDSSGKLRSVVSHIP